MGAGSVIWPLLKKRIVIGYLGSVFVASFLIVLSIFIDSNGALDPRDAFPEEDIRPSVVVLFLISSILILLQTFIPSILFIFFCERKAFQNLPAHILFTTCLGICLLLLPVSWLGLSLDLIDYFILMSAGPVAGFVYWYISGRKAGISTSELRKQIEAFD
jgi:hypothetical protein